MTVQELVQPIAGVVGGLVKKGPETLLVRIIELAKHGMEQLEAIESG